MDTTTTSTRPSSRNSSLMNPQYSIDEDNEYVVDSNYSTSRVVYRGQPTPVPCYSCMSEPKQFNAAQSVTAQKPSIRIIKRNDNSDREKFVIVREDDDEDNEKIYYIRKSKKGGSKRNSRKSQFDSYQQQSYGVDSTPYTVSGNSNNTSSSSSSSASSEDEYYQTYASSQNQNYYNEHNSNMSKPIISYDEGSSSNGARAVGAWSGEPITYSSGRKSVSFGTNQYYSDDSSSAANNNNGYTYTSRPVVENSYQSIRSAPAPVAYQPTVQQNYSAYQSPQPTAYDNSTHYIRANEATKKAIEGYSLVRQPSLDFSKIQLPPMNSGCFKMNEPAPGVTKYFKHPPVVVNRVVNQNYETVKTFVRENTTHHQHEKKVIINVNRNHWHTQRIIVKDNNYHHFLINNIVRINDIHHQKVETVKGEAKTFNDYKQTHRVEQPTCDRDTNVKRVNNSNESADEPSTAQQQYYTHESGETADNAISEITYRPSTYTPSSRSRAYQSRSPARANYDYSTTANNSNKGSIARQAYDEYNSYNQSYSSYESQNE